MYIDLLGRDDGDSFTWPRGYCDHHIGETHSGGWVHLHLIAIMTTKPSSFGSLDLVILILNSELS